MDIDLKTQKILKYIPFVQFINAFCWIGYYRKHNIKITEFFKYGLIMIAFMLLINLPRMILHFVFHNDFLDHAVFYISIYPTFFCISSIAVIAQEKMKIE